MSLKSFIKGWVGETVGAVAQKLLLDPKIYVSLNNITLQTNNGTTQIDHIILSKFGIFVIEAKNMDGWIFGDEKSAQWTQSLFGKNTASKTRFTRTIVTPRLFRNFLASMNQS